MFGKRKFLMYFFIIYRESQRIQIYQTLAKLLGKLKFRESYDMFVNIFQKLHFALSPPNDPTKRMNMNI